MGTKPTTAKVTDEVRQEETFESATTISAVAPSRPSTEGSAPAGSEPNAPEAAEVLLTSPTSASRPSIADEDTEEVEIEKIAPAPVSKKD
jgi:hypothetical protein